MKRLRVLFAILLLLMSLPLWRLQDWAVVTLPFPALITLMMAFWSAIFVALPILLLKPKLKGWVGLIIIAIFTLYSWLATPLSNQATLNPDLNHCGRITYTGFFYPIRNFLSSVHTDDLEVRNQMCWVVKMIQRSPKKIEPEELSLQMDLLQKKLMKPQYKYRATLPWIMFLVGKYLSSTETSNSTFGTIQDSRYLVNNFKLWTEMYAETVSVREYAWYEWPHSSIIKLEYGFIEENWDKIEIQGP